MMHNNNKPLIAYWLGYAGVLPFLFTAINLHTEWPLFTGFALQVFVIYSAVILSFLGGIRWGLALQHPLSVNALILAVAPSLVALGCLLLSTPFWQIAALGIAFLLQGLLDWRHAPDGMPKWMIQLRGQLTLMVLACHGIALAAVMRWS